MHVGVELVEGGGVFAGDDDALGSEAVLEGVGGGGLLACPGVGAGGETAVGQVRGDLCGARHVGGAP